MNLVASAANIAWLAANAPAYRRYLRALDDPERAQWRVLRADLSRNAASAYGRAHGFAEIRSYEEFAQRVPVVDYETIAPWIERVRTGERSVLTSEPVTRLLPTSGSMGARKLVPFTASGQREFNAAIAPWVVDLARAHPAIVRGTAYWAVTPLASGSESPDDSRVPIGFDDDSRYLGGARARLVSAVMAVPSAVRHLTDIDTFRHVVLLHLLRHPDLRLVSVWHPSYLALLLDALPRTWETLLRDLHDGGNTHLAAVPATLRRALYLAPAPNRAKILRRADPSRPETIWPALRVVSCWADGHAAGAARDLARRLPQAALQPKGLLATEACVTLPFAGGYPLAVCSHFFEFLDEQGLIHPAHALRAGVRYEVVVTTAAGLWRYRLGDLVEVTSWLGRTPSLRFLGRAGNVSDLAGEKLSEAFVAQAIQSAFGSTSPVFAMLAPAASAQRRHYSLFFEGAPSPALAGRLEAALRENPHYALCRDLGQLGPVALVEIAGGAYNAFVRAETARGMRLGEIKPVALSQRSGWSEIFEPAGSVPI